MHYNIELINNINIWYIYIAVAITICYLLSSSDEYFGWTAGFEIFDSGNSRFWNSQNPVTIHLIAPFILNIFNI